jgi:Mg2+ and Co2+ transporter CorA
MFKVHFDEQQFENKRADKRKILRRDAIPSLLKNQEEIHLNKHLKVDDHLLQDGQDVQVEEPQSDDDVHINLSNQTDKEIIEKLKKQLKTEQQRNRNLRKQLDKKDVTYDKVFNEDQLKFLKIGTHRGFTWSDETMNKALKLYLACGTNGYEEIRKQNLPYPSVRTLQDRIQGFKFKPGILQDVFNLL